MNIFAQVICRLSCLHALHAYVHIYRYRLNMNKHKEATRQQHVRAIPGHERVINHPTVQADHHHHHRPTNRNTSVQGFCSTNKRTDDRRQLWMPTMLIKRSATSVFTWLPITIELQYVSLDQNKWHFTHSYRPSRAVAISTTYFVCYAWFEYRLQQ